MNIIGNIITITFTGTNYLQLNSLIINGYTIPNTYLKLANIPTCNPVYIGLNGLYNTDIGIMGHTNNNIYVLSYNYNNSILSANVTLYGSALANNYTILNIIYDGSYIIMLCVSSNDTNYYIITRNITNQGVDVGGTYCRITQLNSANATPVKLSQDMNNVMFIFTAIGVSNQSLMISIKKQLHYPTDASGTYIYTVIAQTITDIKYDGLYMNYACNSGIIKI